MGHEAKRRRKAFLSASISAIHRLAVTLALPPPQPSSLQSLQVGNVAMKKEPLIGRDRHWMSTLISSNMDHLPLVRQGWREGDPSPHTQIHMLWHRSECLPPPSLPPSLLASQLARFTAFDQHGLSYLLLLALAAAAAAGRYMLQEGAGRQGGECVSSRSRQTSGRGLWWLA